MYVSQNETKIPPVLLSTARFELQRSYNLDWCQRS